MKILHVLYSGLGGHGNVFFSFLEGDKDEAFEYEALFNGIEPPRQEYIEKCRKYGILYDAVLKKPGLDISYFTDLAKKIKRSDADIVFLHSSAYILPAKMANLNSKRKKKIIVRETQANHLKTKQEWFWLTVAMKLAKKIVFLSEEYNNEIAKKLSLVYRKKKIAIIPNGLDLNIYKPLEKPVHDTIVIGMQSRLVRIKDHLTLLEAFALLRTTFAIQKKKLVLKIAGDGGFRDELILKASSLNLGDSVIFTGMLGERELIDFLHSLDIYVHASLGETMSTAIMQAMACRLPVIASNVKGIDNMISNSETGLLVPSKNAQAMFEAMLLLINDEPKRIVLAEGGYQYALKHFSNERMIQSYKDIFK